MRGELARAFRLADDRVRVIIPDFGGGFGGKHSGECAVEAARLAKAAGKPVRLRWTRDEEFTWAVFRPAAVIDAEASLDEPARSPPGISSTSTRAARRSRRPTARARAKAGSWSRIRPLRHGSYRALAATANTFARECFMDELAAAAGRDPLEFRLAHLEPGRLRAVLEEAARRFDWAEPVEAIGAGRRRGPGVRHGKGSFVAACVEVAVDREQGGSP